MMVQEQDRFELDSQLAELSRVQAWVEALADRHGVPAAARFSIQLCMEEALANVVLHGYAQQPGHPIVISSWTSEGALLFTIEDHAPPFDPLERSAQNAAIEPASLESLQPGGNGIRLLRRFAGSLAYERLSSGNRLTLGFPIRSLK